MRSTSGGGVGAIAVRHFSFCFKLEIKGLGPIMRKLETFSKVFGLALIA